MDSYITEDKVLENFGNGINCAMTVFGQFARDFGLDEDTSHRIAAGFGGGMGHSGVCGCVTGAYMALGLKYGNPAQMQIFMQKKQEFDKEFLQRFSSIYCPQILGGLDPSIPEHRAEIAEKQLMKDICACAVCAACDIVNEITEEDK